MHLHQPHYHLNPAYTLTGIVLGVLVIPSFLLILLFTLAR
jgi:hypothetical protein